MKYRSRWIVPLRRGQLLPLGMGQKRTPCYDLTFILATAVVWRLLHWAEAPMPATLALGLVDIGVHWMLIPAWLQGRLGLAEPSDRVMVKPMEADVRSDSSVGS